MPIIYEPIYLEMRPLFGQYQAKKNQNSQRVPKIMNKSLGANSPLMCFFIYTTHVLDPLLPPHKQG